MQNIKNDAIFKRGRGRIYVKGYGLFNFAKNMGKSISKNISKNLSSKYNQKLLDEAKQSAKDALKTTSKRAIQTKAEATGDLIGNNVADKITKVSRKLPQNNSETVKNDHNKQTPKERYISPEERQKIIDDMRLIYLYNNGILKGNKFVRQYTKSTI